MSVRDYVKRFRSFIVARLRGSKLLPSIVMAHAIYESGDEGNFVGRSLLARLYKNDVRMRADRSWKGPKVQLPIRSVSPYARGRKAWYRVYRSAEQAIGDRIDMLLSKWPSWPSALLYDDMLKMQAERLQASGVSNDPRYSERIIAIVKKNRLYLMDIRWFFDVFMGSALMFAAMKFGAYLLTFWDAVVPWRN